MRIASILCFLAAAAAALAAISPFVGWTTMLLQPAGYGFAAGAAVLLTLGLWFWRRAR